MLRPSDAHLWVPCSLAGNLLATGEYHATPQPDARAESDSRREGTCAGWAAELLITGAVDHPRELVGMQHSNGWVIDLEMAHHAAGFVEYCREFGPVTQAEVPVELFGGLIRGRLDATTALAGVLRIFDLKYGWRPVEAHQNWPMLCYGLAEAERYAAMVSDEPVGLIAIELHIYQPRPHHPDGIARVWRIEAHELEQWRAWLYAVATEARDNPRASPGPQCDRCPAQVSCVANAKTGYHLYAAQAERRQHNHTAAELVGELRFLEMAEDVLAARRKAVAAEMEARMRKGEFMSGAVLKPRKGNRVWAADAEAIQLATGLDPYDRTPVLKSPAALEREGASKHMMKVLTNSPHIGFKIDFDPQAYAEQMFGKAK